MTTTATKESLLSPSIREQLDNWLEKFPADQKQSAVLIALHLVQDEQGWVATEYMDAVADYLDMPKVAVYEVASFYSLYDLKPVGRNKLYVCNNISCMLCGSEKIITHIEQRLGIKMGQTTDDGKFTLKPAECLAACINAPVMQINDIYHENLTPERVDEILERVEVN